MESDVRRFDCPLRLAGRFTALEEVLWNEAFTEGRCGGLQPIRENMKIYNVVV